MCSIAAIYKSELRFAERMSEVMKLRGPDRSAVMRGEDIALAHNRLAVMDPKNGDQPMSAEFEEKRAVIAYNGEIYNTDELRAELEKRGMHFRTGCDTEVVLGSYLVYGEDCPKHLNGIFAFVIWDETERKLFAARDRLGVKPLYYTVPDGGGLLISSEIKGLLANPLVRPTIGAEGVWQLLLLSPVTLPESTVYENIYQLGAGKCLIADDSGIRIRSYWSLCAHKPTIYDPAEAAEQLRALLFDAVKRQCRSDVPLCTFLSGGLDSSVLTAIAAKEFEAKGEKLSTFSFEYEGEHENFRKSLFQPASDDEFAPGLAKYLGTDHRILTAGDRDVAKLLPEAAYFRDMPGQADIDSSLLYFCRQVRKSHTVAISGECSDEIFGGYPWFYRPEMINRGFFPWMHDPTVRLSLFRDEFARPKDGMEFLSAAYKKAVSDVPIADSDDDETIAYRRATMLSVNYFMSNLLERKDRMSMAASLEVRVPFADHRIIEFVYDLPKSVKFENGVEKSLLRRAAEGLLPDNILHRKKSPYPKTHSKGYERLVREMLDSKMREDSFFASVIDRKKVCAMIDGDDITWLGQLMSRPQLMAWLVQFAFWSEGVNFSV